MSGILFKSSCDDTVEFELPCWAWSSSFEFRSAAGQSYVSTVLPQTKDEIGALFTNRLRVRLDRWEESISHDGGGVEGDSGNYGKHLSKGRSWYTRVAVCWILTVQFYGPERCCGRNGPELFCFSKDSMFWKVSVERFSRTVTCSIRPCRGNVLEISKPSRWRKASILVDCWAALIPWDLSEFWDREELEKRIDPRLFRTADSVAHWKANILVS